MRWKPPTFYFATGSRPQRDDVAVALAVGQTAFLVPACSAAASFLLDHDDPEHRLSVALDSHIFDPARPTLEAYAEQVAAWFQHPRRFAFAISYDHLGNPVRSMRDHDRLVNRLHRLGVAVDDPVVPVVQRAGSLDEVLGPDLPEWDAVPLDELLLPPHDTPVVALGGMAFAQYGPAAMSWLVSQLHALGRRPGSLGAHLLGLTRPDVVRRSPVVSFDSSRPVKQAAFGWPAICPHYQARYGLAPELLAASRAARLAYWTIDTRDRIGLPWRPLDPRDLSDDHRPLRHHGKLF